jgi:hypothetical protein
MKPRILITFTVVLILLLGSELAMADAVEVVTINTTPLDGTQGYLAFDFIGGTPVENNTVTISDFVSNATLGALTPTGGASGSISPGHGTLNDSQFFNELLQGVTFGSTLSFDLDLTTNVFSGGIPDEFAFYLLDSTQNPYASSDPTGADSVFVIIVNSGTLTPDAYTSSSATATITSGNVAAIPEPGSVWLVIGGISSLALIRRRHNATVASE